MPKQDATKVKDPTAREALDALPAEGLSGPEEFVQGAIANAVDLMDAKHSIQADLQQSRDFLAFAVTSGQASTEQADWIAKHLPKRSRSTSENGDDGGES